MRLVRPARTKVVEMKKRIVECGIVRWGLGR